MTKSRPDFTTATNLMGSITVGLSASVKVKLPSDLVPPIEQFWAQIQVAKDAYNRLSNGVDRIWDNPDFSNDYKQTQVQGFVAQVFQEQKAAIEQAGVKLSLARERVDKNTTPALLDSDLSVHELKLMNAREEVKTALDGMNASDQRETLIRLFEETVSSEPAIAYFIAATDAYKRLLRDQSERVFFGLQQVDLRRQLLPEDVAPYFAAIPVLNELQNAWEIMEASHGFTAMDNGW